MASSNLEVTSLDGAADRHDTAVAILLTVNATWEGAPLWARYLARTGD